MLATGRLARGAYLTKVSLENIAIRSGEKLSGRELFQQSRDLIARLRSLCFDGPAAFNSQPHVFHIRTSLTILGPLVIPLRSRGGQSEPLRDHKTLFFCNSPLKELSTHG